MAALALVVLNVAVVNVLAQGTTNQTVEKGGLEKTLKNLHQRVQAQMGAAAVTHRYVLGLFVCPANFTSIESQCDIFHIGH